MKELPLTQGRVALVDDEDFERLSQFKWCATFGSRKRKWYAVRRTRVTEKERWLSYKIRLGHFILDYAVHELSGSVIDHKDDNSLNYQRSNLQIISQEANMQKVPGWKRKQTEPDRSDEW